MEIRASKDDIYDKVKVNGDTIDTKEENDIEENVVAKKDIEEEIVFNFEKKQPFFKNMIRKIDQYLYDIEVMFKTDMSLKLDRKNKNEYIFKSFFTFFFCFIFSYAIFTGYFLITNKINKHHYELDQQIRANGTKIVFDEVVEKNE